MLWEKKKNQVFQTSDLVDAFVQISIIDVQDPETHLSAYHHSDDTSFALQEENSLYGTENVWYGMHTRHSFDYKPLTHLPC